jgi:hypothetical protein
VMTSSSFVTSAAWMKVITADVRLFAWKTREWLDGFFIKFVMDVMLFEVEPESYFLISYNW